MKIAILVASDKGARGERVDESGKVIQRMMKRFRTEVVAYDIVPDDKTIITKKLKHYSDKLKADIVVTTGGTGLGPRDVTPEATRAVIERDVPGLSEYMRLEGLKKTRRSILSRGVCGMRKKTLIINLPGSPKGVKESLGLIIDIIPHALHMMAGHGHPAPPSNFR